MPTQLRAWAHAWTQVDEAVRRGPLTSLGAPTKRVRQYLFRTIFAELPTELTAYVHQGETISEGQQTLIERAVRDHRDDLLAVTEVATYVRGWIATHPALRRRRAEERGLADLWTPNVRDMLRDAGGVRALVELGEHEWAQWLSDRYHVDADHPEDLPSDAEAIRRYLLTPGVDALLTDTLAQRWALRPPGPATWPTTLEPLGLDPARVPDGDLRRLIDERADAVLAAWPDDALSRALGLTATPAGSTLRPPPMLRPEDDADARDEVTGGVTRPRERSLRLRLIHKNKRGEGSDTRALTVGDLVAEEIERCAQPLGLLEPPSRRALVAAGATLAQTRWIDDPDHVRTVPDDHPDKYLLRVAAQVRRCFFARHTQLELLPLETQRRIAHPVATLGPRLWSRLHNGERDGKASDPYEAVADAWQSWRKDLPKPGAGVPPPRSLDSLPGAPGLDGAPVDPRVDLPTLHVPDEDVVVALQFLAETLGAAMQGFVKAVWDGQAEEAGWAALTASADAVAPGIIEVWPSFAAVVAYLNELRSDLP